MKKGDRVAIYQKPVTREDFEEEAVLIERLSILSDGMELWTVKFKGDSGEYQRTINTS